MAKRNGKPEPRSAQRKIFPSRTLKVRKGDYPHQYQTPFGSKRPYQRPHPVPWIQIKGYWLEEAGFSIGSVLDVHIVHPRWIILCARPSPD